MGTILAYGDSNTHGTRPLRVLDDFQRHPPGDRWPDRLALSLDGHRVIDEGLPGRTTVHDDPIDGGARNGLTVLPAILGSHTPLDVVLLMLGTNDLKHRFSVTAWEIARSVERLGRVVRAEAPGARLILIAPAPVREVGVLAPVFAGAEVRQAGLADALRASAARLDALFVDAGATVSASDIDGVHWDAASHHAFAAALVDPVTAALA